MLDCLKTLNKILLRFQNRTTAYGFSLNMVYSLQDLLDAQRKYFSIKQPEREICTSLDIFACEDQPQ